MVVEPREKDLQTFLPTNGRLLASGYLNAEGKVTTPVIPGFSLDLARLFEQL